MLTSRTVPGGFKSAYELGGGFGDATALVQANVSEGGRGSDLYHRANGTLFYTSEQGNDTKVIGGGWDVYRHHLADGSRLSTTAGHRLFVAGRGWTYASDLAVNDRLRDPEGQEQEAIATLGDRGNIITTYPK